MRLPSLIAASVTAALLAAACSSTTATPENAVFLANQCLSDLGPGAPVASPDQCRVIEVFGTVGDDSQCGSHGMTVPDANTRGAVVAAGKSQGKGDVSGSPICVVSHVSSTNGDCMSAATASWCTQFTGPCPSTLVLSPSAVPSGTTALVLICP